MPTLKSLPTGEPQTSQVLNSKQQNSIYKSITRRFKKRKKKKIPAARGKIILYSEAVDITAESVHKLKIMLKEQGYAAYKYGSARKTIDPNKQNIIELGFQ